MEEKLEQIRQLLVEINRGIGLDRRQIIPDVDVQRAENQDTTQVPRVSGAGPVSVERLQESPELVKLTSIDIRLQNISKILSDVESNGVKILGTGATTLPNALQRILELPGRAIRGAGRAISGAASSIIGFPGRLIGGVTDRIGRAAGAVGRVATAPLRGVGNLLSNLMTPKSVRELVQKTQETNEILEEIRDIIKESDDRTTEYQADTLRLLLEGNDLQEATIQEIVAIRNLLEDEFLRDRRGNLDRLEDRRERKPPVPIAMPVRTSDRDRDRIQQNQQEDSGFRFPNLLELLGLLDIGRRVGRGIRGVGRSIRGGFNRVFGNQGGSNVGGRGNNVRIINGQVQSGNERFGNQQNNNQQNNNRQAGNQNRANRFGGIFNNLPNINDVGSFIGRNFRRANPIGAFITGLGIGPTGDGTISSGEMPSFPGDKSQVSDMRAAREAIAIREQNKRERLEKEIFDATSARITNEAAVREQNKRERLEKEIFDATAARLAQPESQALKEVEITNKAPIEVVVVNGNDISGTITSEAGQISINQPNNITANDRRSIIPQINIGSAPNIGDAIVSPGLNDSIAPIPRVNSGAVNRISGQIAQIEGQRIERSFTAPSGSSSSLANIDTTSVIRQLSPIEQQFTNVVKTGNDIKINEFLKTLPESKVFELLNKYKSNNPQVERIFRQYATGTNVYSNTFSTTGEDEKSDVPKVILEIRPGMDIGSEFERAIEGASDINIGPQSNLINLQDENNRLLKNGASVNFQPIVPVSAPVSNNVSNQSTTILANSMTNTINRSDDVVPV